MKKHKKCLLTMVSLFAVMLCMFMVGNADTYAATGTIPVYDQEKESSFTPNVLSFNSSDDVLFSSETGEKKFGTFVEFASKDNGVLSTYCEGESVKTSVIVETSDASNDFANGAHEPVMSEKEGTLSDGTPYYEATYELKAGKTYWIYVIATATPPDGQDVSITTCAYACYLYDSSRGAVTVEKAETDPDHQHELEMVDEKAATCVKEGNIGYWKCSLCGACFTDDTASVEIAPADVVVPALGHAYSSKWTVDSKATPTKDGKKSHHCTRCTAKSGVTTIPKASGCKLSATSYTYSGGVKTPTLYVKDSKGKTIAAANYTVTKSTGRKNVGKYNYVIKFKGAYDGKVTKSFTIKPAKASISSVTLPYSKLIVNAQKKPSAYGASGFQIAYKIYGGKWVYTSTSKQSTNITKILKNKKYYVSIRPFKKVNGTTYYGAWSAKKTPVNSEVKVTFKPNKGKIKKKSQKIKKVKIFDKYGKLPKPKRKRYKFLGWYTKKSGGTRVTADTYTLLYKDHTLYAHWFGPKGKGKTISKAEYNRLEYGMSYDEVRYLIGGGGDRISSYTDSDYVDNSYERWVDESYWDYDYDDYGNEYPTYVSDGYYETVDNGYWVDYYHETYWFKGKRSGHVELEFVDDELDEIYTYHFK